MNRPPRSQRDTLAGKCDLKSHILGPVISATAIKANHSEPEYAIVMGTFKNQNVNPDFLAKRRNTEYRLQFLITMRIFIIRLLGYWKRSARAKGVKSISIFILKNMYIIIVRFL